MFNKFRLVQFKDGRFGARRGILFKEFLDLYDPKLYTWTSTNARERHCKGTEAQVKEAIKIYNNYKAIKNDNGEIVS